jgi:YVTN family beta-propeller protein
MAGIGDRLVVTLGRAILNANDDGVAVFDKSGAPLKTFETGGMLHDAVAVGGKVWVAHSPTGAPGWLDVIDPVALTTTKVNVGNGPYGLTTLGNLLYVMCQYDNTVVVVDTTSGAVVETIPLSGFSPAIVNARELAVSPAKDVYIESDGMISVVLRH